MRDESVDICYACRTKTDRSDPPETSCPVCGEDPVDEQMLRGMSGKTVENARICIINDSGEVLVHQDQDGESE